MGAGRPKGGEKKGGRQKGVKNKDTLAKELLKKEVSDSLMESIETLTDDYFKKTAKGDLLLMKAKDRFDSMSKLLEYRMPKKVKNDLTINSGSDPLTILLKNLAGKDEK